MRPGATSEDPASGPTDPRIPAPGADSAVREGVARTQDGAAALVVSAVALVLMVLAAIAG